MSSTTKPRVTRKVKRKTGEKAKERFLKQGYRLYYRIGRENHCPGCGGLAWYVGRTTAECASCETALDIEGADRTSATITARRPKAEEFILSDFAPRVEPMDPPRGITKLVSMFIG